ncbi:hypothetical protein OH77DRAFT_1423672 [Trametes cingulata]|nr:hypothetical protein OH77DRAFT_1423672 [Trametes cingulata]
MHEAHGRSAVPGSTRLSPVAPRQVLGAQAYRVLVTSAHPSRATASFESGTARGLMIITVPKTSVMVSEGTVQERQCGRRTRYTCLSPSPIPTTNRENRTGDRTSLIPQCVIDLWSTAQHPRDAGNKARTARTSAFRSRCPHAMEGENHPVTSRGTQAQASFRWRRLRSLDA